MATGLIEFTKIVLRFRQGQLWSKLVRPCSSGHFKGGGGGGGGGGGVDKQSPDSYTSFA